jgi:membrane-associated HD superfamily phosphohydrolase
MEFLKKASEKPKETLNVVMSDGSISDEYVLVKKKDLNFEREYNRLSRSIVEEASEMYDTFRTVLRILGGIFIFNCVLSIAFYERTNEHVLSFNALIIVTALSVIATLIFFLLPSSQLIKDILALKMKCKKHYENP